MRRTRPEHPERSERHRGARGFTLIESMMSLTVLGIGIVGLVTLQTATISTNQNAAELSQANGIARSWVERLQRDATRWNHPSPISATSDLSDTLYLKQVTTNAGAWMRPSALMTGNEISSPAFDRFGRDVDVIDADAYYCTHLRLTQIYPTLLRAEVRVFWLKRRLGNLSTFESYGLKGKLCSTSGNEDALGADRLNFNWAFAVAGVSQVTAGSGVGQ